MGATGVFFVFFFLLDLLSLFPNGFLLCDHGLDLRDRLMCEFNQSINQNVDPSGTFQKLNCCYVWFDKQKGRKKWLATKVNRINDGD